MQLTLDRFGRMVLPKSIRDDFGLQSGDILEAEETRDTIVLRPVLRPDCVKREGSALVFTGRVNGSAGNILDDIRQSRMDHVTGKAGAL